MDNRLKFLYFFVPIESFKGGQNRNRKRNISKKNKKKLKKKKEIK